MEPLSEIKENIRKIAGKQRQMVFTAKVVSVDGDTCTVELEDTLKLTDVRLRAVINGENSKILVTPKNNSYVLVADLTGDLSQLAVIGYSEVEKIEVDANDKIIFNGGKNGGLVEIQELTDALNNLVAWCRSHTHTVEEGVAVEPSVGPADFVKDDYENKDITH